MTNTLLKRVAVSYSAGSFGSLLNSALILFALTMGLEAAFGVTLMAQWSLDWLYPRLVWGGVLAFLFVLPLYRTRWVLRGFVWSIVPTIPNFFIMFPGQGDTVMQTSLEVGLISIGCMYLFNCVWGLVSSYFIHKLAD